MENPQLHRGMVFETVQLYTEALSEYLINEGIQLKYKKNNLQKVTMECHNKCGWRIYVAEV